MPCALAHSASAALRPAALCRAAAASPAAKTAVPVSDGAVDELVRAFFGAAPGTDLSEAGIDRYPGWDSLRHFELMLHLEQELSIRFSSTDLERTTDMRRLREVVAERQAQGRGRA